MNFSAEDIEQMVKIYVIPWGLKLLAAIAVFVIGRWIAKALIGALQKVMNKASVDKSLVGFVSKVVYALLLMIVILAALEQLGVETTSALAVLGGAALAVGLALQGSLSNFAAGVMILLFRPFQVDHVVEAAGVTGKVVSIETFSTILLTPDNRRIVVANAQIYGGVITNYTAMDTRRVDMTFGIAYDDDIKKAKELFERVLKEEERVLADPAPAVFVSALADSSVNFAVRPWVKTADYWGVMADVTERIKLECDANGISIPFPQRDVHLYNEKAA